MYARDKTRTQRKSAVRELLAKQEIAGLIEWAREDGRVIETLSVLLFEQDELLRWRAIEATGRIAGVLAGADMERVRDLLRRLLWSINDESGAAGWYAPETIGAILFNVPQLIDDFGPILASFLREEPFERGAHWAIAKLARLRPDIYANCAEELEASLDAADPAVRAHALQALDALGRDSAIRDRASLLDDEAVVELYDFETGGLTEISISTLARRVVSQTGPDRPCAHDPARRQPQSTGDAAH